MREINFTPEGLVTGGVYIAELLLNNVVQQSITNLVENVEYTFNITTPATYVLRIRNINDNSCLVSEVIQALFPIVTFISNTVDCNTNTYNITITLTNPSTSGSGVQYGWSLYNSCTLVNNWTFSNTFILPADDVPRYIFVKNNISGCCSLITTSINSPCVTCTLNVINISFTCNG